MLPSRGGDVHARVPVLTVVTDGATPVPATFSWYIGQAFGSTVAGDGVAAPAVPVAQRVAARATIPAARIRGFAAMAPPRSGRTNLCPAEIVSTYPDLARG